MEDPHNRFQQLHGLFHIITVDPKYAKLEEMPQSYIENVKTMHESGGHGSQGSVLVKRIIYIDFKFFEHFKNTLQGTVLGYPHQMLL